MAAGIYTGKVRIRTPNATPAEQTLEVHLELTSPPLAPRLATGPEEVAFSASASDSTGQQSIQIRNTGGGELRYLLETGVPWLRLSSGEGTVTAAAATAVTITADATGLAPGNYSGRITVRNLGDGTTAEISVRLAVTGLQPSLLLSQSGLSFQGEVGPAAEFPHYDAVLNSGDGRMTWTAQARTNSGENWIRVEPAAGTSEGNAGTLPELKIWVNATNLAPGNYKGFVDVTAAGAQNSPRSIEVQLKVIPAGGRPRPIVTRSGVVFVVRPGQTAPKSEVTGLWNVLTDTLQWNTSSAAFGPLWFSVSPSNGAVTSSKDQAVLIVPDLVGAQPGIYDGAVTVIMKTSKWGAETPRAVQVLGVVARPGAAGAPAITKTGLRQAESACVATRLVALVTTLGDAYQATVNVPVPIEVRAVDDCGEPLRNGTALATFSQDDSPLPLVSLRDGRWTGTWFPKRANESVELTVELRSADRKLGASVAVSGTVGNP